jgi:hypothetical protein
MPDRPDSCRLNATALPSAVYGSRASCGEGERKGAERRIPRTRRRESATFAPGGGWSLLPVWQRTIRPPGLPVTRRPFDRRAPWKPDA